MNELNLAWAFLFGCLNYFVALTGADRMVTGIIEPAIKEQVFHAYVLWHTWMNQAVAFTVTNVYIYASPVTDYFLAALIYWTIVYCWVGGGLDGLYFMMRGSMPEWTFTWHWMPFEPQTWQFWTYALAHLTLLITAWTTKFAFGATITG